MKKFKTFNQIHLFVIFISFLLCLLYANYNIKKFDKETIDQNNINYHQMIKNDVYRYFSHGYEIKTQLKNGENYFETGRQNFTKYLYPRIIALYFLIFDYELYDDKNLIKTGIFLNFLIFQIILYYLSILFLYKQIKKIFNKNICLIILIFLSLEPTLIQYHGSFWSESIFFSIQILILGFLLKNKISNFNLFVIGILLSLLAIQRSNGFFYIFPIIIFFFVYTKEKFIKKISFLLTGFSIILIIVGYHNLKISNKFSILPDEMKSVIHAYVLPEILSKNELNDEKILTINHFEDKKLNIPKKIYNYKYQRISFLICENIKKNEDYRYACNYLKKRSIVLAISNPLNSLNYFIKKSLSFSILNPFHIYSDNHFLSGKKYYMSETHKKLLPIRIIYSLSMYIVCLIGLSLMYNTNKKVLFLILISALYFFLILSWHGNNRYFTPVLVYLSIPFAYGMNLISNKLCSYINFKCEK